MGLKHLFVKFNTDLDFLLLKHNRYEFLTKEEAALAPVPGAGHGVEE